MAQSAPIKSKLVESDIIFDCPHCGKSLVIDCRGVGLNITCPQCEKELEVPYPEGFDLSQLDKVIASNGLLADEAHIVAPAPAVAEPVAPETDGQIDALQAELQALRAEKQLFVQQHAELLAAINKITQQLDDFRKTLDKLGQSAVPAAAKPAATQKLV